jgi:hypothetical protein
MLAKAAKLFSKVKIMKLKGIKTWNVNLEMNPNQNLKQHMINATNVKRNSCHKMDLNLKLRNLTSVTKIPITVFAFDIEPKITFASLWTG